MNSALSQRCDSGSFRSFHPGRMVVLSLRLSPWLQARVLHTPVPPLCCFAASQDSLREVSVRPDLQHWGVPLHHPASVVTLPFSQGCSPFILVPFRKDEHKVATVLPRLCLHHDKLILNLYPYELKQTSGQTAAVCFYSQQYFCLKVAMLNVGVGLLFTSTVNI